MIPRYSLIIALLLAPFLLMGQETDSSASEHSPKSATIRSAILPGLGQAYNSKYWKIPIVYAGLGGSAYFVVQNSRQYNKFKDALIARHDPDQSDPYVGIYSESQLNTIMSTYRRWRDLSYIGFIAVYVLQIVDANVDAHLHDFDVSDDLSLRLRPWSGGRAFGGGGFSNGVSLSLSF